MARGAESPHESGPVQVETLRTAHRFEDLCFDAPVLAGLRTCQGSEPYDAIVRIELAEARFDRLAFAAGGYGTDPGVQPGEVRSFGRQQIGACNGRQCSLLVA